MYGECYLFQIDLENKRISVNKYYNLLATLHCCLMQQTHLYDASLLLFETKNGDSLAFGFAIRSYP
jgi:hypothetical protein